MIQAPKTPEQIHYEHLTSFLKWAVSIVGTLIATAAAFAIYISFNDRIAMREEYTKAIGDLKLQIADIKNDTRESVNSVKEDSRDAVRDTRDYAEKQISGVAISTHDIAMQETNKQLGDIFKTDRIQDLIKTQATNEIKNKVDEIVSEEVRGLSKIDDAAVDMKAGSRQAKEELKSYFIHPDNKLDSIIARDKYDLICEDYYINAKNEDRGKITQRIDTRDGHLPSDIGQRRYLQSMVDLINTVRSLEIISDEIMTLDVITNNNFKPFQIEEINAWYNGLKK